MRPSASSMRFSSARVSALLAALRLGRARPRLALEIAGHALEGAHRELLLQRPLGHDQGIGQADERAGLPRRQLALANHLLHRARQLQQAHRVGDVRAALADRPGDLVVALLEILDEAAIALRFVDRRQVGALQVLDQADLQGVLVVHAAHHDRHFVQLRAAAPPASAVRRRRSRRRRIGPAPAAPGSAAAGRTPSPSSTSASRSSKVVRGCILPGLRWPIGKVSGGRPARLAARRFRWRAAQPWRRFPHRPAGRKGRGRGRVA